MKDISPSHSCKAKFVLSLLDIFLTRGKICFRSLKNIKIGQRFGPLTLLRAVTDVIAMPSVK